MKVQLRVLQSSLLLVSSRTCAMSEELLSQALLVCFALSQAKDATVKNAALATVRQILSMLFDRVAQVDGWQRKTKGRVVRVQEKEKETSNG